MPFFYGEELLAPHATPKMEDQPLLAVCDWLFSIVTQHNGDCYSMRNLRRQHAVVTGTHYHGYSLLTEKKPRLATHLCQNMNLYEVGVKLC